MQGQCADERCRVVSEGKAQAGRDCCVGGSKTKLHLSIFKRWVGKTWDANAARSRLLDIGHNLLGAEAAQLAGGNLVDGLRGGNGRGRAWRSGVHNSIRAPEGWVAASSLC